MELFRIVKKIINFLFEYHLSLRMLHFCILSQIKRLVFLTNEIHELNTALKQNLTNTITINTNKLIEFDTFNCFFNNCDDENIYYKHCLNYDRPMSWVTWFVCKHFTFEKLCQHYKRLHELLDPFASHRYGTNIIMIIILTILQLTILL